MHVHSTLSDDRITDEVSTRALPLSALLLITQPADS